jgi:hypothetical protein
MRTPDLFEGMPSPNLARPTILDRIGEDQSVEIRAAA